MKGKLFLRAIERLSMKEGKETSKKLSWLHGRACDDGIVILKECRNFPQILHKKIFGSHTNFLVAEPLQIGKGVIWTHLDKEIWEEEMGERGGKKTREKEKNDHECFGGAFI